jgi:hypothetical protein
MASHDPRLQIWRSCGVGLGLFAIVLQVLLSGLVQPARAADRGDMFSVCTHDGADPVADDGDPGKGDPGGSSGQCCPACACLNLGGLLGPPPASGVSLPHARSQSVRPAAAHVPPARGSVSPYASRASPHLG